MGINEAINGNKLNEEKCQYEMASEGKTEVSRNRHKNVDDTDCVLLSVSRVCVDMNVCYLPNTYKITVPFRFLLSLYLSLLPRHCHYLCLSGTLTPIQRVSLLRVVILQTTRRRKVCARQPMTNTVNVTFQKN